MGKEEEFKSYFLKAKNTLENGGEIAILHLKNLNSVASREQGYQTLECTILDRKEFIS